MVIYVLRLLSGPEGSLLNLQPSLSSTPLHTLQHTLAHPNERVLWLGIMQEEHCWDLISAAQVSALKLRLQKPTASSD